MSIFRDRIIDGLANMILEAGAKAVENISPPAESRATYVEVESSPNLRLAGASLRLLPPSGSFPGRTDWRPAEREPAPVSISGADGAAACRDSTQPALPNAPAGWSPSSRQAAKNGEHGQAATVRERPWHAGSSARESANKRR